MRNLLILVCLSLVLAGCAASRSSASVKESESVTSGGAITPTLAAEIIVTEEDILDRNYVSLGDIKASVSKTTIFNKDPTNEMVADKLREEAAKLGADAVILVRYGTVGVSMMSWGKLGGNGRAVKFVD